MRKTFASLAAGHEDGTRTPSLDESFLDRLFGELGNDGIELLREIGTLFIEDGPAMIEQIKSAVAQRDADLVEKLSHTFKGSSKQFAATRLASITEDLEEAARGKDLTKAEASVQALKAEWEPFTRALRKKIASG